jgi:ubiquinone/menaquinone biosynthesis C-methylase UbiE
MCPICKSENYYSVGVPKLDEKSKKIINKEYQVGQCYECKFYYVQPEIELSLAEWKLLYDENYFTEQTDWYKRIRAKHRKQRIGKLKTLCDNDVKNFLDVGCGEGYMLLEAVSNGWNAYGVDITDNRLPEFQNSKISFVNSDLLSARFPDNFFDCIYMDSVLEHVLNTKEHVFEIKRILKNGGVAYIGVPNEDSLQNDVKKFLNIITGRKKYSSKLKPFLSPYHVSGFNKYSISYLVKKADLKIELLRNFATKSVFRMTRFTSKDFLPAILLTIINFIALVIRREYYLEIYVKKK